MGPVRLCRPVYYLLHRIDVAKYLFGAKTMWIGSIANVQQLSSSGKLAGKFADVWLNCRSAVRWSRRSDQQ